MTEQQRLTLSSNTEFLRMLGFALSLRDAHQLAIEELSVCTQNVLGMADIPPITELYELWKEDSLS